MRYKKYKNGYHKANASLLLTQQTRFNESFTIKTSSIWFCDNIGDYYFNFKAISFFNSLRKSVDTPDIQAFVKF